MNDGRNKCIYYAISRWRFLFGKTKRRKNMRYIEVWFLEAFGNNELHVDQIVYDGYSNLAKKELANRFIGYTYELHNLEGGYYICFFHKSEKNKPIKSNLLVLKTKEGNNFLNLVSIKMEDVNDIKYLATVYLNLKRG